VVRGSLAEVFGVSADTKLSVDSLLDSTTSSFRTSDTTKPTKLSEAVFLLDDNGDQQRQRQRQRQQRQTVNRKEMSVSTVPTFSVVGLGSRAEIESGSDIKGAVVRGSTDWKVMVRESFDQ
jgi:hypothetical protein